MLLLSDELMRCCAAGTKGCLDLRRCAFALDGRMSTEWCRCPGFILLRLNTLGQRKLPIVISLSRMLCFAQVCASHCALNASAALQGAYTGSTARRPRDSVAPLRRSSAGWMPARVGRLSAGVGRTHPVTIRKASMRQV